MKIRRSTQRRSGLALMEVAMCIPAVLVLLVGSFESRAKLNVQEVLHVAAFDAVHAAIDRESTNSDVLECCQEVLNQHAIEAASISISAPEQLGPIDISTLPSGTPVTIRIQAPMRENSLSKCSFFTSQIEAQVTMVKE